MLRDRRLIEHAGRNLDVLALQCVGDVVGGQAERLHAIGIEPHPHGVVACAEHGDRADAVDARDRVGHFERGVVGDEQRVARLVRRVEVHDHHQVGRRLLHGDADIAHVGGQARVGDGDAVLHLHLGDVQIGAELEADRDRKATVGGRVRRDIDHILDAVDLLFDRRDHRRGHDLGTGAGILPGDADQGRRYLGILRDRQAQERHRAQDREDDRNHRRKDRPIDEEVRDAHFSPPPLWGRVGRGVGRSVARVDECSRLRMCATSRPPPLPLPTRERGTHSRRFESMSAPSHQFRPHSALVCAPSFFASFGDDDAGGAACSCTVTFMPGRARIRPLTTTRSEAATPSLITRMPSSS